MGGRGGENRKAAVFFFHFRVAVMNCSFFFLRIFSAEMVVFPVKFKDKVVENSVKVENPHVYRRIKACISEEKKF